MTDPNSKKDKTEKLKQNIIDFFEAHCPIQIQKPIFFISNQVHNENGLEHQHERKIQIGNN